eukprot:scaffold19085_cov36-Tisochrysis_lutea.AAC.1
MTAPTCLLLAPSPRPIRAIAHGTKCHPPTERPARAPLPALRSEPPQPRGIPLHWSTWPCVRRVCRAQAEQAGHCKWPRPLPRRCGRSDATRAVGVHHTRRRRPDAPGPAAFLLPGADASAPPLVAATPERADTPLS